MSFNTKIRYYCPKCISYTSIYRLNDNGYIKEIEKLCRFHKPMPDGRKYLDVMIEKIIKENKEVLNVKRTIKEKPSTEN